MLLRAIHDVGPDDYLAEAAGAAPGSQDVAVSARHGCKLPQQVQVTVKRANDCLRERQLRGLRLLRPVGTERKHRATGQKRGRPKHDNRRLANVISVLVTRGMKRGRAVTITAEWLAETATVQAGRISYKSARDRIRTALRKSG